MIIAVDFDGVCCECAYPEVGLEMDGCIDTLKYLQSKGHRIIIWTCRENGRLDLVMEWFGKNGFTPDAYNDNIPDIVDVLAIRYPGNDFKYGRKPYVDMFIDDRNYGGFPGWYEIRRYFDNMEKEENDNAQ